MGHSYYSAKKHAEALRYYRKSVEYSDFNEYKYELYHWMANCYHLLKDYPEAIKYHKMFLDNNWEPERLAKLVDNSRKYLQWSEKRVQN